MANSKSPVRDTDWVIDTFSQLLKYLKDTKGKPYFTVNTSVYQELRDNGMGNCIIVVERIVFDNPSDKAAFSWRYANCKEGIMYVLSIFLNESLFKKRNRW